MPFPALPGRLIAALLLTVASTAFGADTVADRAAAHLSFQQRIKDTLRAPQWFSEGERFIYWSATGPDAGTWVAVDAATGKATPLIAPQALATQLQALTGKPAAPLYNPQFVIDSAQRGIVFSAAGQTYALAQGTVTPVAASDRRAWRLSPNHAFAPDGGAVAISEADGGWTLRAFHGKTLARGKPVDGRQWEVPPHSWSPDTRNMLVWQNDQRGMHQLPLVDYSSVLEKTDSDAAYNFLVGNPADWAPIMSIFQLRSMLGGPMMQAVGATPVALGKIATAGTLSDMKTQIGTEVREAARGILKRHLPPVSAVVNLADRVQDARGANETPSRWVVNKFLGGPE